VSQKFKCLFKLNRVEVIGNVLMRVTIRELSKFFFVTFTLTFQEIHSTNKRNQHNCSFKVFYLVIYYFDETEIIKVYVVSMTLLYLNSKTIDSNAF
jgi:hypothetical protein